MHIKIDPKSPGIRRQAKRYEAKLHRVLELCMKRARNRDPEIARLLESAVVEGVDSDLKAKKATITFRGKPLRGSLHEIYDWTALDQFSAEEIAEGLRWSLGQTLREYRKR